MTKPMHEGACMIKVCHMTSAYKSDDLRIFHKECLSLAKAGYDVYIVAPGESYEQNGIRIIGSTLTSGGRFRRMTQGAKSVYEKALGIDADLYHIYDPELLPYAMKLKKLKKKVIFDSREDFVETILEKQYLPLFLRFLLYIYFKIYYSLTMGKYDAIITVSPHISKKLEKQNKNTHVITNYPIINDRLDLKKYTISKNVIYAGGISSQWCHDTIIIALGNCDGIRYLLLGPGEENYINSLKELPNWKSVDYYGRVSIDEVINEYKNASIGIAVMTYNRNVGNKTGTLGNTKIFEYMAEALPIVCTDYVLWKEIVDKYACGICVNPYSSDEIANAINYLIDNHEIAKEMGQNGRRAVLEEYNWDMEEIKLLSIYRKLFL